MKYIYAFFIFVGLSSSAFSEETKFALVCKVLSMTEYDTECRVILRQRFKDLYKSFKLIKNNDNYIIKTDMILISGSDYPINDFEETDATYKIFREIPIEEGVTLNNFITIDRYSGEFSSVKKFLNVHLGNWKSESLYECEKEKKKF